MEERMVTNPFTPLSTIKKETLGADIQEKIKIELVSRLYKQGNIGLLASLLCASVVFAGLLHSSDQYVLIGWYLAFGLITIARFLAIRAYSASPNRGEKINFWSAIFTLGAFLAGMCWGFAGSILLPFDNLAELSLILFILAGVTSGAVPILSEIKAAVFSFLAAALIPLIVTFIWIQPAHYILFLVTLVTYYIYLNILAYKTHKMINNTIALQFDNNLLLQNLSTAKQALEYTNIKLDHAAKYDPLTNLANRTLFESNFEGAIQKALEEHKTLTLLYFDIDNFKEINDAYGHHVGDLVLQKVANRVLHNLPAHAIVSRLGGDELTIILENMEDPKKIAELSQALCSAMSMPFYVNELNISVTCSIGISIYPIDGRDTEMLLRNADKAMYYSKQQGGNSFHFNTEITAIQSILINDFSKKDSINPH
jgi:diguanylate cyclase (GGDEF)-like protein